MENAVLATSTRTARARRSAAVAAVSFQAPTFTNQVQTRADMSQSTASAVTAKTSATTRTGT